MRRVALALWVVLTALIVLLPDQRPAGAQTAFVETFDGQPAAPAPWQPADWAVDATNSDMWASDGQRMDPMAAHHGPDCAGHPAMHQENTLAGAAFLCNGHVMTAMSAGYGTVYLTPPALLDFSAGEAVLRFDMSTFRTVGRDWVDVWITPFEDQFALPLNLWLPPYQGEPRRAVQLKMEGSSRFEAYVYTPTQRSTAARLPVASFAPYETFLQTSAVRRDTFELRLSATRVRFGMPGYDHWWVDAPISPPLDWSAGVVQLGQHAYNPTKDCSGDCANTWHWDTVSLSPSRPLQIVPTAPRWAVARRGGSDTLTLQRPAPAGALVRFAAVGANVEFSYDGGATWTRAVRMPADRHAPEHFSSWQAPIPEGATAITVRATGDSYISTWMVANVNVLSQGPAGPPPATPTPPPPTATPAPTDTPTPGPTATATPTPPAPAGLTVTFDDRAGQNQGLNGQYPSGVIDWGSGQWYHSGPWGAFATKSVSFTSGGTSRSFTFVTPRRLVSLRAFNGGGGASTVTLACAGQPTKTQTIPAGQTATIATGWTGTCSVVTVTSSNGWDTNFDDLVIE